MPLTDLDCPECDTRLHTDHLLQQKCGCGHKFSRDFYVENDVSKGYWKQRWLKPPREEIIEELRAGNRDPSADADATRHLLPEMLTFVHLAHNGSVVVSYTHETSAEGTNEGDVYKFDLVEGE